MKRKKDAGESQKLRQRANRQIGRRSSSAARTRQDADARKQLHELQVHQVELEMQNTELRKVRAELHSSLTRYAALYEFAPIGYLTLERDGSIAELNQAADRLLGLGHAQLLRNRLGAFVAPASRAAFNDFLSSVFETAAVVDCEVELLRQDGTSLFAQITAVRQDTTLTCLATLIDVTVRLEASRKIRNSEHLTQALLQQNRQLTRRMFELLETERRNIAREVHDELGQWLTAIQAETAVMIRTEDRLQAGTRNSIRAINASTAEMHNVLRRILLRLRPTMLDTIGLTESLRELVQQWCERHDGIGCKVELESGLDGLGDALNITLFRIVQEALTNIAKHAKAQHLGVRLERGVGEPGQPDEVLLTITDDGVGFDPMGAARGMGILGMRERVIAMEGRFDVSSRPGHGVRIDVRLPIGAAR